MESEKRFKRALLADKAARVVITLGGGVAIFSVFGIMAFIFSEVAPLMARPKTTPAEQWAVSERLSPSSSLAIGVDEYRDTAFRMTARGDVEFFSLATGKPLQSVSAPDLGKSAVTSASRKPRKNWIAYGAADGRAGWVEVKFRAEYANGERRMVPSAEFGPLAQLAPAGVPINKITGAVDPEGSAVIAGADSAGRLYLSTAPAEGARPSVAVISEKGGVSSLAMKSDASQLVAGMEDGHVQVFELKEGAATRTETFKARDSAVTAMDFLAGDDGLVVGGMRGSVTEWLPVRYVKAANGGKKTVRLGAGNGLLKPGAEMDMPDMDYTSTPERWPGVEFSPAGTRYHLVRSFEPHKSKVVLVAPSPRDKGFLTASADGAVAYRYSTTGKTHPVTVAEKQVELAVFAPKADAFYTLGRDGVFNGVSFDARHPDVSFATLFSRVWYGGYNSPKLVWQSTGGTDDFEAKYSLWPLIFGTLKGTLYAMVFSVPIAILGAIYLSQLAPVGLRNAVKPVIELMAAIPSVVIGFLAGLWLSPLIDRHLMAVFMVMLSLPAGWLAVVLAMWAIPRDKRPATGGPRELLFLLPVAVVAVAAGLFLAPYLEGALFGGDLKSWLYSTLGVVYDPRNCIVVGFALGFAVMPIIFTISEDALTAVPQSLASASFALAASRWQTAIYVVLPAASPGIFAAVMLGLGRAVGETMIVLMATGNTPIMDWSVFNGLRAMSATIAVEMPEAPVGGSLYRVLFLVGFLLFAFTFAINTVAEFVSARLRRKYSRF